MRPRTPLKIATTLFIISFGLAGNLNSQSSLTDGLVSYYPFNGNANDASGNGNNGQLGTGMSFTTDRFGNPNSALLFSNPPEAMTTTVQQPAGSVFSLSLWFNIPKDSQGAGLIALGSVQTGTSPMVDKLLQVFPDGTLDFYLFPGHQVYLPTPSPVNDGKWHQTVATLSAQGMCLYEDGLLVAQNASVTTSQGYAGWWRVATGQGSLDDVRIYDRALASDEVASLYQLEAVPEPCSLAIFGLGLVSVIFLGRRQH